MKKTVTKDMLIGDNLILRLDGTLVARFESNTSAIVVIYKDLRLYNV